MRSRVMVVLVAITASMPRSMSVSTPVSYTHLDVYKRQIEAIAEYHRKRSNGTWMTRDMIDMWKALHRQRIAHCVSCLLYTSRCV